MDLMMGLSAIKQTLDITKELRGIDDKVVVAEFKLKIADIIDKLLDAKQALIDAREREAELQNQVIALQAAAQLKMKLQDEGGKLYVLNDQGRREGEPYCNHCHVEKGKLFRLVLASDNPSASYFCASCKLYVRQ